MNIGKIQLNGLPQGTAWLVHERYVVTAAHCVGAVGNSVDIHFLNAAGTTFEAPIAAEVIYQNHLLDAAMLRLAAPRVGVAPFALSKKGGDHSHPEWHAAGFPIAVQGVVAIVGVHGTVGLMSTALMRNEANATAIQLSCAQGVNPPPAQPLYDSEGVPIHSLAGISGSAVMISERSDRVIGFVRCAMTPLGPGTIYATPIEAIWEDIKGHLPGVVLHEWSRTSGTVRVENGAVVSNLDRDLLLAAWNQNVVKDITVDVPWDEAGPLIPAVLRLVLHQDGITRLHVRNEKAWNARLRRYADSWITLENFTEVERAPAIECVMVPADAGTSYDSVALAAAALHGQCDLFVLEQLATRIEAMFEAARPGDYCSYDIAGDVLAVMSSTWTQWKQELRGDAALLHHFFALMLTADGRHECGQESCPGAGPLTFDKCIFPAAVFTLAIAPFLPTAFKPKRPQPGNIGAEGSNGHTCGVAAIQRGHLDTRLRGYAWATPLVLLQHLLQMPKTWEAATSNFMSSGRARASLSSLAPTTLIIPRDEEIRQAIGTSGDAVRQLLRARLEAQRQRQEAYAAQAAASINL